MENTQQPSYSPSITPVRFYNNLEYEILSFLQFFPNLEFLANLVISQTMLLCKKFTKAKLSIFMIIQNFECIKFSIFVI